MIQIYPIQCRHGDSIIINTVKPTQQGLRFLNAYQEYYKEIWRGQVINVVNADKNYIGIKEFEKAANGKFHFDISLPFDGQVELAENNGIPALENYYRTKLFGGNYRADFMELVGMIDEESDV